MSGYPQSQHAGWWRVAPAAAPSMPTADREPRGKLAFGALLAFLFFLVIVPQSFIPALQPLRPAFITAALAVIAYLMQRIAFREPLLDMNREIRVTGLLVAWAVVTIPFSLWAGGSIQFLFGVYFKTLVVFLLLAHVIDSRARMEKVAWALTLMAVPLALGALRNYMSGAYADDRIVGYEGGLTANPNDMALMLNMILPLAVALFLSATKWSAKALLGGIMALMVTAIIVTFSRSGFLTLALIGAIYFWYMFRRRQQGLAIAAVVMAFAALPFVPGTYIDRLATISSIEADQTGSSQARWADAVAAVEYVAANPLVGAGVGQNALAMNQVRGDAWLRIHNVYLEYATELGLPGLVLFLLLLYGCMGAARQARRRAAVAGPVQLRFFYVSEAVWVSLAAFAFAGLFYPAGYQPYFYLFAGLALAARTITAEAR